ncbi:YeeE/YedE family protein [Sphingomonas jaspsi]|uniref:YeeE/YedE family protein n=1 Tax=Sphingomonas jaspsi TaxID=392409 RepID=UPI0004B635BF|nr:YeeE/YedE thiosulfate transporter family protein [Sphingomonas jaspsi]
MADQLGGLVGGVLIGLAGAIMLLGAGRIAGVSGIAARGLGLGGGTMSRSSAWMFLVGLPVGALVAALLGGKVGPLDYVPLPAVIVAGLLVGFGTRLGSGCTSGHGVCGVSRLSQRSLVATATFMASGIATVAILRAAGVAL